MQSPEQLTGERFSDEVPTCQSTLSDAANKQVDFNFKPSAKANSRFQLAITQA